MRAMASLMFSILLAMQIFSPQVTATGSFTPGDLVVVNGSNGSNVVLQDGGLGAGSGTIIKEQQVTQVSSVSVASNVFQTILSTSVTMPASCPCHVIVHWSAYDSGGGSTSVFVGGVEDGSGSGELLASHQDAGGGNMSGMSASQYSPLSYSGTVTFTLVATSTASSGASIPSAPNTTPGSYTAPGYLNILVVHP